MTNSTGGDRGHNETVRDAFLDLQQSERFREYPLQVRDALQRIAAWLPPRQASLRIIEINASFAKMLRDKAARERGGYKWGNYALFFVQAIVKAAVDAGALSNNRVKCVPKLPPPPLPASTSRRRIRPVRQPISSPANLSKKENSSA